MYQRSGTCVFAGQTGCWGVDGWWVYHFRQGLRYGLSPGLSGVYTPMYRRYQRISERYIYPPPDGYSSSFPPDVHRADTQVEGHESPVRPVHQAAKPGIPGESPYHGGRRPPVHLCGAGCGSAVFSQVRGGVRGVPGPPVHLGVLSDPGRRRSASYPCPGLRPGGAGTRRSGPARPHPSGTRPR